MVDKRAQGTEEPFAHRTRGRMALQIEEKAGRKPRDVNYRLAGRVGE